MSSLCAVNYTSKKYQNEGNLVGEEFVQHYEPIAKCEDGKGTCKRENAILFMEYFLCEKDNIVEDLRYKHLLVKRKTDGKVIHHFAISYRENGKMYVEDRSNGTHKKIEWCRYKKANKFMKIEDMTEHLKESITYTKCGDGKTQITFVA